MKKTVSLILALVIISALSIGVSAGSRKPSDSDKCEISFDIKQAEPQNVIKDGKIGEKEYERLYVNTNAANTPLFLVWGGDASADAEQILSTVEYYFSWDNTHGLNVAVRYKPVNLTQQIKLKKAKIPEDGILNNCGLGIALNPKQRINSVMDVFYFAIAKSTVNDNYLVGYWTERGVSGKYLPVGGQDFVIEYSEDGYVTYEWSIPLTEVYKTFDNKIEGKTICMSISAMGGDSKTDDFSSCYGVSLGDRGYLVRQGDRSQHATARFIGTKVGEIFAEVKVGDYYHDAVKWAFSGGITNGTSSTTFSPKDECTRAQVVTFLWRACGSPLAGTSVNIFKDIKDTDYYYNAVLWAAANGIVNGTDATHFSPKKSCTRAEVITLLHRAKNTPAAAKKSTFTDVKSDSYYSDAVNWGVANGITTGTTPTTFSPKAVCTRGQIVTFLYRAFK